MEKSSRFNEIKKIYARLSRPEKELLHTRLKAFEHDATRNYEDIARLIQVLQFNPTIGKEEAVRTAGFEGKPSIEVNSLLLLTKEFLMEQLLLDMNINRPGVYSNRFRITISNAKKLEQAQVLLARGLQSEAIKLLEEVQSKADKYENFDQSAKALKILGFLYAKDKGIRTFRRFEGYIKEAKIKSYLVDQAESIYAEYRMHEARGAQPEAMEIATAQLEQLEKQNKNYDLRIPVYIALLLRAEMLVVNEEYRKADHAYLKLIDTIRNSPSVQSEEREAYATMQIARVRMHLAKYSLALEDLNSVQSRVKKSSHLSYLGNKYEVLVHFYEKNYSELSELLPRLLKSKYTLRLPHAAAQFHYYSAFLDYLQGNYKSSAKALIAEMELKQELVADYATGLSYLLFLNGVELLSSDEAFAKEVLELAVKRSGAIQEDHELAKRDGVILKLMDKLHASNFDFKKVSVLSKSAVQRLAERNVDASWRPLTYEILPFHQWFAEKLRKAKPSAQKTKSKEKTR